MNSPSNVSQPSRTEGRRPLIHGRIRNRQYRVLPDVSVTLTDGTGAQIGLARTNHQGEFEVYAPPAGTCVATFSHPGYRPLATVVSRTSPPLDITLDATASVRGTVSDRHGGRPVAAATITAIASGGQVIATTKSDPSGRYALTGLDDVITLVAAAPGADPFATIVQRGPEPVQEIDLELDIYSAVTGTVTAAGHPVAGLPLILRDRDDVQVATAVTDSSGRYRFDHIRAGRYTVDQTTCPPQAKSVTAGTTVADLVLGSPSLGEQGGTAYDLD